MDDRETTASSIAAIIEAPREMSVSQARWILMPLFGLWILFSVAGVVVA